MATTARSVDDLLRGLTPPRPPAAELRAWFGWLLLGGCFYGAIMGCHGGVVGERLLQVVYSSIKVPILLGVTFVLTLPSFFVLNTALGLRDDFPQVWQSLLRTQAVSAVLLAALTPYTALWYLTSADYGLAILVNAAMFGVASIAAQVLLRRAYQPLIDRNPRHRLLVRGWIIVYAFVGIQMGWTLRPFIGDPNSPTRFFREGAFTNAYIEVVNLVFGAVRGAVG